MGAQLDSLDIQRLQVHLLGRGEVFNSSVLDTPSKPALQSACAKQVPNSNPVPPYGPYVYGNETFNLRAISPPQPNIPVRQELPSTIPESVKDLVATSTSLSQGSTQPVSQSVYEQFTSKGIEQSVVKYASVVKNSTSNATEATAHTYVSGQTGHVDLLDVFEQPSTHESAENNTAVSESGEVDAASRSDVRAGAFAETHGLGLPTTPANHGKKRIAAGHSLEATPILPTNPFANLPLHMGSMMDLSQVFKATQAPSSPVTNALTSDGISERPSPDMFSHQRPATADPASSPAKQIRSMLTRAVTEPQAVYISIKQSQEEREKLRVQDALNIRNEVVDQEQSDDDFESQESVLRRRLQRKRMDADARDLFVGVTAAARPAKNRRGRGRGRGRLGRHAQSSSATRSSGLAQLEAVVISDDMPGEDAQSNTTEDETEHEDEVGNAAADCAIPLEEDNKENFDVAGIQVPMTTSRATNKISTGVATQPSPTAYRSQHISPSDDKASRVDVLSHGTSRKTRLDGRLNRSQPFAIADSQPSQGDVDTRARLLRSTDPTSGFSSSPDSRAVILQSQPSRSQTNSLHPNLPKPSQPIPSRESNFFAQSGSHISSYTNGERPTSSTNFANEADSTLMPGNRSRQVLYGKHHSTLGLIRTEHIAQELSKVERTIPQTDVQIAQAPPQMEALTTELAAPLLTTENHHAGVNGKTVSRVKAPDGQLAIDLSDTRCNMGKSTHTTRSFETLGSGQPENISTMTRSKSVPSESLIQRSTASSLFDTARTHLTLTHSNVLPSSCTARDRERVHLRTISQINTDPLQTTEGEDIDVDINILTDADVEFQAVMNEPSSIEPLKKRRRGPDGQAMRLVDVVPRPALPNHLSSTQDREHDGQQAAAAARRFAQDQARTKLGPSLPVTSTSKTSALANNKTESSKVISTKRPSRPSPIRSINGFIDEPQGFTPSKLVIQNSKVSSRTIDPMYGPELDTPESAIIAPNRVFAHFNGKCAAYFPATCLGVVGGDETRFKVRFDDGTVDVINAYGVRRLELRKGDAIKLNLDGARTKNYVVVEVKDKLRPSQVASIVKPSRKTHAKPRNASPDPTTDIYGYTNVVAELKQREIPGIEQRRGPRITASLQDVYLTQTMWTGFKDRQYTHPHSHPRVMSGLLTPSERPSTPSTPCSRSRRNKKFGLATLRLSTSSVKDGTSLFENMAFGISNIADNTNRNRTSRDILSNGGRILNSGFDELFDLPPLGPATPKKTCIGQDPEKQICLKPSAESLGFTCLLADKYCRSHKFVQALAAGIPCLATRWVRDCVRKQQALPWEPYLLPAGESEYLCGAVKSRVLQPYPTGTARLATIISCRPNFLNGHSVLLIMSKSEEDTMSAHPFITHALGASKVSRAHSLDAAAKAVAEAQANGEPWDWVYSHKKEEETERYLFGATQAGKKRKRGRGTGGSEMVYEKGKTRVVGNNFVIQSLILGQLMDTD